jgi:UDP-N-acetylmuramate--alanine ligase
MTCFEGVDRLIILPVWAASEKERFIDFEKHFGSYDLAMADYLKRDGDSVNVCRNDEVIETIDHGIIIGFGAGDITYQIRGEK